MRSSSIILVIVVFSLVSVISCESRQTGAGSKKASSASDAPLYVPASSQARMQNDEGVGHYQQGHWDVAAGHFARAVKAEPNSAVAHYNFALTLDKMGKHEEVSHSGTPSSEAGRVEGSDVGALNGTGDLGSMVILPSEI